MHPPDTPAAFRAYLRRNRKDTFRRLLLIRREGGEILGVFNLSQIFLGNFRSAYLGYWVGAPFVARGYMTEGMGLLLRYAFRTLKLHRVEANVQPGNAESLSLVRRTGFRREGFSPRYLKIAGRWRDHERWAITVEDFRAAGQLVASAPNRAPPHRMRNTAVCVRPSSTRGIVLPSMLRPSRVMPGAPEPRSTRREWRLLPKR